MAAPCTLQLPTRKGCWLRGGLPAEGVCNKICFRVKMGHLEDPMTAGLAPGQLAGDWKQRAPATQMKSIR